MCFSHTRGVYMLPALPLPKRAALGMPIAERNSTTRPNAKRCAIIHGGMLLAHLCKNLPTEMPLIWYKFVAERQRARHVHWRRVTGAHSKATIRRRYCRITVCHVHIEVLWMACCISGGGENEQHEQHILPYSPDVPGGRGVVDVFSSADGRWRRRCWRGERRLAICADVA